MAKNPRLKDLTGIVFGNYTVVSQSGNTKGGAALWLCKCSCGNQRKVVGSDLRAEKALSCGHDKTERVRQRFTTHGQSGSRLHRIWKGIKARCSDLSNPHYGNKGIRLCDEWNNFSAFMSWAKQNGYQDDLTIERLDNALGYGPNNCTWIPKAQQSFNRTIVAVNNAGVPWIHVARANGITDSAYRTRVFDGWDYELASSWPMFKKRKKACARKPSSSSSSFCRAMRS